MFTKRQITLISLAVSLAAFAAGCKKKAPAPPPPPPPAPVAPKPPAAPSVTKFEAEPSSIMRGESSVLSWEVSGDVTSVSINEGVGTVQSTGSQRVSPTDSTTYALTATGPGGTSTASTTVNVSAPPPPPPPPPPPAAAPAKTLTDWISELQDAYFDYDKSDIRSDAQTALTQDAGTLKTIIADFPDAVVTVEGYCDERGSAEYNLGLGDRRATSAKDFLVQLGVPAEKLKTISYGKEKPVCTEQTEDCWQKNRHVHFSTGQ